ncbi:MAG: helix-turn-helix domain-containing protein [Desulfuromonadaceae bacterium]|nr:helix-turn-helix domain-containing protein [Desulfuromonadaceae bacterium]
MIQKISSPETLGQALRAERKHKGMSQKAVGHSVGMEQHTISKIEKGNPGTELNTLFRLLAALDLELNIQPRQKPAIESTGDTW